MIMSSASGEDQIAQPAIVRSACPRCRESKAPTFELVFSGFPDLLFGEKVWEALLAELGVPDAGNPVWQSAMQGLSVDVCPYLDPHTVMGCTEVGRRIVRNTQEAAADTGGE